MAAMTTKCYFLPLMRRVIFVAFEGLQTLDLTGPAEVFAAAGREDGRARSEIIIGSAGGGSLSTSAGCTIVARDLLAIRPKRTDTVLVVGGEEDAVVCAMRDARLTKWLVKAARVVRRIGSVCSGAFVLAHAGLLDGRRVATHWSACDRLAAFRPALRVDRDAIFIEEDGRVWTSAGVTTGIDMALAMVEEDFGRSIADGVAARLVLYARRPGFQSQFSDALVAQRAASDPLGPVIGWAKTHLERLDVEVLAKRAGMSLRTLHRRCLTVLGETPAKLVEKLRVERARTLLKTTDLPTKELATKCGFGSTARMNRAFSRALGMTPAAYRTLFTATHPTGVRRSGARARR